MTTKDILLGGHHELCRNHARSSSQGQCPWSETIRLEGQWMWQRIKALTNVKIWAFLCKLSRGNLVRSPSASGETSKSRTSSMSRSIEMEKPWSFHNLGCPETVFQARNSRVNDCVKERGTKCHKKKITRHTLTGSSIIFLLPDLSVKVNDGWHYRNINIIPAIFASEKSLLPPLDRCRRLDGLCQTSHSRYIALWLVTLRNQSDWWWFVNGGQWRVC